MGVLKLIDRFHTWSNSLIKNRLPLVSLYYYTKPRLYLYWRTQAVYRLIKGDQLTHSDKNSVLFFTVHKSASTFLVTFLKDLAQISGHVHIDINGFFASKGQKGKLLQENASFLNSIFYTKGYIYGPLRNYLPVPNLSHYPVVIILRDPRDVLTSQYFSIKNTHPLITPQLIRRREKANSTGIDEHVIEQSDRFLKTYEAYIKNVLHRPNVLLVKYEDMIKDFNTFLQLINKHAQLQLNDEQLKMLDRSDQFKMKGEDTSSHKRKIISGDYKEKLQADTISFLNRKFKTVLLELAYSVD